jgi:hypothetical protein
MIRFIKKVISTYFYNKSADCNYDAKRLLKYPENTFAHARGKLLKSLGELYYQIGNAI